MNKIFLTAIVAVGIGIATSCSDDINRPEQWPEWPSKGVVTVNGGELKTTYYEDFSGTRAKLQHGATVTFSGIDKLKYALQNHFWDIASDGSATFKGESGDYDIIYDHLNNLLYVEQPETKYPDMLYVIGEQLGHSGATSPVSTFWSIDGPDHAQSCRKIGSDKFEISLYLSSGFKFKFFTHRGWGTHEDGIEIWAEDLKLNQPELVTGTGDFCAGALFQAGVYDLTVDLAAKTFDMVSRVPVQQEEYHVNGTLLTPSGAMLHTRQHLVTGEEVVFSNFGGISEMVQPDFYDVTSDVEGRAVFLGPTGDYDIYLDAGSMLVYTECPAMNGSNGKSIWITGSGFGHPMAGRATIGDWKLTEPVGSYQMIRVQDGVYAATMYLGAGFDAKFYQNRDWGTARSTEYLDPLPVGVLAKGISGQENHCQFTGDLLPGADFTPGVYRVVADFNNKIVYLDGMLKDSEIAPVKYEINGKVMTDSRYDGFKEVVLNLTKGEKMTFRNIQNIEYLLQPEYYEKQEDGSFVFNAVSGEYRILYDADVTEYIWTERTGNNGLWITGQYFGHPRFGGWGAGDPNNSPYVSPAWSWDNPRQYLCCAETSPGVYETSFLFHSSWAQFTLYGERGWTNIIKSSDVNITDTSSFGRSYYWENGVGNDTNFGCTKGNIGEQYGTYRLRIDTNSSPIVVEPVIIK